MDKFYQKLKKKEKLLISGLKWNIITGPTGVERKIKEYYEQLILYYPITLQKGPANTTKIINYQHSTKMKLTFQIDL